MDSDKLIELASELDLDEQAILQAHMKTIIVCEQMKKKVSAFEKELETALQNYQQHQAVTTETFTKIKEVKDKIIAKLNDLSHIATQNNTELKHIKQTLQELVVGINTCKAVNLWKDTRQIQELEAPTFQNIPIQEVNKPKIIYISYCYANNRVLSGAKYGWVTTLHYNLNILLQQKMPDNFFELWINDKLKGNSQITPKIITKIESASAFVIVFSAAYKGDSKCNLELQTFLSKNSIEDKKIFFLEYDNTPKPATLNDLRGYRFWQNGGKMRTLATPAFDTVKDGDYHSILNELARDIAALLQN